MPLRHGGATAVPATSVTPVTAVPATSVTGWSDSPRYYGAGSSIYGS